MEQLGRKKRTIKVSKQTKEYISTKYNIPVKKLTYIFNYTRDTNLQAMEIISEAINYENNVVAKKLNELSEVVYGVPNWIRNQHTYNRVHKRRRATVL